MPRVLVVCTANICRSPVVEALLRRRLQEQGASEWHVESAGTWAMQGQAPSRYSALLMAERGLDISGHRSRVVDEDMLAQADLVLCMEIGHAEALRAEFRKHAPRIHLLSEMTGEMYSINDPYGGPRSGYEAMVDEVTKLIEDGLPRIMELAEENASK